MSAACPQDVQLVRLFEDALDGDQARSVEAHSATCARCQDVLHALRSVDALIAEPEATPDDFTRRLLALPDTAPAPSRAGRGLAAAAAVAAVVLVALALRTSPSRHNEPARPVADAPSASPLPTATQTQASEPDLHDLSLPALHRLVRGDDLEHARLALAHLGEIRRRESLPVLIEALGMSDRRAEAVEALGALGDTRAVRSLEPLLRDPETAGAVREALVRVGGGDAALALDRAIARSDDPAQVVLLTDALARANGVAGLRRLGRLLQADDVSRACAARVAIQTHGGRLLPYALTELGSASASDVASALRVLDVLSPPAAVPALAELLPQRAHRARAAEVLACIDTAEAAEALWHARMHSDVRPAVRRAGPAMERLLLGQLKTGDRRTQRSAIDLLGLCGGAQSVAGLTALVDDPALAPGALLALGRIGGQAAVEALAALSLRPGMQRRVIAALGLTGSPAAVAELERLGTSKRSLCVDAQRALATIPHREAVEAIVRLDQGRRSHRGAGRLLREMDRELVLATLDTLITRELAVGEPTERETLVADRAVSARVAATARRIRHAVGGSTHADPARIALN